MEELVLIILVGKVSTWSCTVTGGSVRVSGFSYCIYIAVVERGVELLPTWLT